MVPSNQQINSPKQSPTELTASSLTPDSPATQVPPQAPKLPRILIAVFVLVLISSFGLVAYYWYSTRFRPAPSGVYSYDTNQQQAIFVVFGKQPEKQSLLLKYTFPYDLRGKIITAQIRCILDDSRVTEFDANGRAFSKTTTETIYQLAEPGDTLQGICDNKNCSVINKNCELLRQVR